MRGNSSLRVLILEDDPGAVPSLLHALDQSGLEFHAYQAATYQEFETQVKSVEPDLVLVDYDATAVDGFAALASARRHKPDIPFIFLAETPGEQTAILAFEGGATDFLLKSQLDRLAPTVHRALHKTRERLDRRRAERHLQVRLNQQATVAELGQRALEEWDLDVFLSETVCQVAQTLDVKYCLILELLPENRELRLRAGVGWKPGVVGQTRISADPASQAGYSLRVNRPVMMPDLSREQRFHAPQILIDHGVSSGASVRISAPNRPYGVFGVFSEQSRSFNQDDVHFLQAIAHILSTVIARHDQENQLRASEERVRQLNEQLEQRVAQRTAALKQANEELEAFSYSVSHDLRAPLRHIQGFIEILMHELQPALDPQHANYLQTVADSACKMSQLIESLLAFSRLGRVSLQKLGVDLNDLVRSVLPEFDHETKTRRVFWHLEELPQVNGDPSLLRQVFLNLLSNALKYSRTRPESRIRLGRQDTATEWIVFVQDNGVGFDPELIPKLFGVFQRLHPVSAFEGTGIGLANVQRIIQRHGGRVWAEGAVDQGATFYLSLPK